MSYPSSPDGLFNITSYVDNGNGTATFAGYGVSSSCGSNGVIYSGLTLNTNTEQLGYVYVTQSNNCLGIWKVPRASQPPLPETKPRYDCLNAACTPKNTYNTPGLYQSLAECEQSCGPGCGGVCLSNSDWAAIQGLAAQNKSKHCS
jgi:hypothetical protein